MSVSLSGKPPPPRAAGGVPLAASGENFGSGAARLAGFCGLAFGWSPEAFWRATPAEVASLVTALAPQEQAPVTSDLIEKLEKRCG